MTTPPPPPPEPGTAHKTVSRGLAGTLRGFLYAAAATSLAATFATFNELTKFDEFIDGDTPGALSRLNDAEEVSRGIFGLFAVCVIVLAVLTIIWWYQSYQAIEKTGATDRTWSAGWAVGGWFIPFANFVIPKLVLNEVDRVSAAAEEGSTEWRGRRLLPSANMWWVFLVIGGVLLGVGGTITNEQLEGFRFDADQYRTGLWFTILGLAADVPAALFGAASVRVLGERINR